MLFEGCVQDLPSGHKAARDGAAKDEVVAWPPTGGGSILSVWPSRDTIKTSKILGHGGPKVTWDSVTGLPAPP